MDTVEELMDEGGKKEKGELKFYKLKKAQARKSIRDWTGFVWCPQFQSSLHHRLTHSEYGGPEAARIFSS